MKKILLGTTALVLLSGAAAAQQVTTSSPFTVTLGGSIRHDFAFFDEDVSNVNREQRIDTRLTVQAEAKADNGLVYGFLSRIRTNSDGSTGMIMDRKVVYGKGSWGAIYLGDHDDARTQQEVLLKTVGIGQADLAGLVGVPSTYNAIYWSGEGNFDSKITYMTPSFSGFTAGLSYTPEVGNSGRGVRKAWDGVAGSKSLLADYVEAGAAYAATFGGVSVKVGGGIGTALTERADDVGNTTNWNVGAQVGYAGFTGSGFYVDNNDYTTAGVATSAADQYAWGLGIAYETGPWGVGLSYVNYNTDTGATTVDDTVWGLGAAYRLAPGLSLQGDLNKFDFEGNGNEGWQAVIRTRLDF